MVETTVSTKNKGGRNGLIDLSKRTFTKLEVLRRATMEEVLAQGGWNTTSARWLCRCECGKEKVVLGSNLLNGSTKSCGSAGCKIGPKQFNERPRHTRGKAMAARYTAHPVLHSP